MPFTIPSSVRSHRCLSLHECLCDPVEAVKQIYCSVRSAYFIATIASDHLQTIAADTVRGMFNSYNSITHTVGLGANGNIAILESTRLTPEAEGRYGDALATFAYDRLMSMDYESATFGEWSQPLIAPLKFIGALVTEGLVATAATVMYDCVQKNNFNIKVEEPVDKVLMFNNTAQVCPLQMEKSANDTLGFNHDTQAHNENEADASSSQVCNMQMDFSFLEMCPADASLHEKSVALAGDVTDAG